MTDTTEWFPVSVQPVREGWYDYKGFMISEDERYYWNGSQFGIYNGPKVLDNWIQLAECVGDFWRGIVKP